VPPKSRIKTHLAPQLSLEAAILRDGAFTHQTTALSGACSALSYLKLTGRTPAAEPTHFDCDDALMDGVLDMVRRLMATYDAPEQPYLVHIRPRPRFGVQNLADTPFDHLARSPEWHDEDEA